MAQGRPLLEALASYDALNDPSDTQHSLWVGGAASAGFPGNPTGVGAAAQANFPANTNWVGFFTQGRDIGFLRNGNVITYTYNEANSPSDMEWENTTGSPKTVTHFVGTVDIDSLYTDPLLMYPVTAVNITVPDGARLRITSLQLTLLNGAG